MKVPFFFLPYTGPGPRLDNWQPPFWTFAQAHVALWLVLFLLSGILLAVMSVRWRQRLPVMRKLTVLAAACIFLFTGVILAALAVEAFRLSGS